MTECSHFPFLYFYGHITSKVQAMRSAGPSAPVFTCARCQACRRSLATAARTQRASRLVVAAAIVVCGLFQTSAAVQDDLIRIALTLFCVWNLSPSSNSDGGLFIPPFILRRPLPKACLIRERFPIRAGFGFTHPDWYLRLLNIDI